MAGPTDGYVSDIHGNMGLSLEVKSFFSVFFNANLPKIGLTIEFVTSFSSFDFLHLCLEKENDIHLF